MARQTRRQNFADTYLAALLAQASHLISAEFHAIVRRHGMSVSEWRILGTLSCGGPVRIGHLAEITLSKQPTLTRALSRMERRGQVVRVPSRGDRRVTFVRTTPKGRRAVTTLIRLAREHERRVLEPFGLARAEELKEVLRGMIQMHRGNR
jgi:DNA-binding MarR family transcriptional regulator